MGTGRIELPTSVLSGQRSTTELRAQIFGIGVRTAFVPGHGATRSDVHPTAHHARRSSAGSPTGQKRARPNTGNPSAYKESYEC